MVPSLSKEKRVIILLSRNGFLSNSKPFSVPFQYYTQDYKSNNQQIQRQNWTGNKKLHPRPKSVAEEDESKENHGQSAYSLGYIVFMIASNYPKINSYLHNNIADHAVRVWVSGQHSSPNLLQNRKEPFNCRPGRKILITAGYYWSRGRRINILTIGKYDSFH